jgi:hypothetical protein
MKNNIAIVFGSVALCMIAGAGFAADAPVTAPPPAPAPPAQTSDAAPMVPPAAAGVFSVQKKGASRLHLTAVGHKFTSRGDVEKYLAYRAADLTLQQKATWFTFIEARAKGDTVPAPKRDPAGLRYSFRMENWRPAWRYKLAGDAAWKSWSPFSGAPFFADGKDPKTVTDFEVSADIAVHKGQMDDADPLAFEAGAVSDLLINQVSPPQL